MDTAELVFRRDDKDLLHVRLDRAETCIGRHPTNDVVVPEASIPEVAAVLVDRGALRFKLRDLTDGQLRVNGQPVEDDEVDIVDGAVLKLGSYELHFRVRPSTGPGPRRTQILDSSADTKGSNARISFSGASYELPNGSPFNIGSDADNDLVIEDDFTSSFHCRIGRQNGRWILSDLASTNGTQVNGLKVGEAELPETATIVVGRAQINFDARPSVPADDEGLSGMIGQSEPMRRVFAMVRRVAKADAPVLVVGASGTGKELVARALHDQSSRAEAPFLAINCGALASSVVESELFGHVKGSFTGATADRKGAFEACEGGTIFLDEIGELPLELQPKLLRVLEASAIRKVGGTKEIAVDARVVAATHRNLKELVEEGRFREDLFHRLYVLNITIPPLRDRADDVLPLAAHFLRDQSGRALRLSASAEQKLRSYPWPGNVRELRNVILRAVLLTDGDEIREEDLELSQEAFDAGASDARHQLRQVDEAERQRILDVLEQAGNNRAEAARLLGLSKSTFHDRLKRLGIPLKFSARSKA